MNKYILNGDVRLDGREGAGGSQALVSLLDSISVCFYLSFKILSLHNIIPY